MITITLFLVAFGAIGYLARSRFVTNCLVLALAILLPAALWAGQL